MKPGGEADGAQAPLHAASSPNPGIPAHVPPRQPKEVTMPIVRHWRRTSDPPPPEAPAEPGVAVSLTPVKVAVAPQLRIWADPLQARLDTTRYLVTLGIPAGSDIALVPIGSPQAVQELRGHYPGVGLVAVNDHPGHRDPAEIAALLEAGADIYWGGDDPDELSALIKALARRLARPSR
jgi:hypothetical protein